MLRTFRTFLVVATIALSSGACSAAAVGTAAIAAVPRLLRLSGDGRTVERGSRGAAVPDDRTAWGRQVVDERGNPLQPGTAGSGDVLLVWEIPVRAGVGVEAVAGLGRIECVNDPVSPIRWEVMRRDGNGRLSPAGEAWRSAYVPSPADSPELVPLQAEALAMRLGVAGGYRLTWLLLLPTPGDYVLRATWSARGAGLQGSPCIDAWGAVDMGDALSATAPSSSAGNPYGGRPRTPYEAYQMETRASRSSSASDEATLPKASTPASQTVSIDYVSQSLGLLGVPEYDLVRLHQAAMQHEMGSEFDPATLAVMAQLRAALIDRGLATAAAAICRATQVHALDQRGLKAWDGEPTVPPLASQQACGR